MDFMRAQFIGKEVQVYPNDTHAKYATVVDINEAGVTFKATAGGAWKEGSVRFVAFSASLSFVLVE